MKLISDELRQAEYAMRLNNIDEEIIKIILKAHIDGITIDDIMKVAKLQRELMGETT